MTLSADTTDGGALPGLVDQLETNTGRRPTKVLADAGYLSENNLAHLDERCIDAYVATRRDRHSVPAPTAPRGRIPSGLSRRERMARKLTTKRGRAEYRRRKAIVEPVFGQTKEARRFRRFRIRGRVKVTAEWHLVCDVHNLAKLFRSGRAGRVVDSIRTAEHSPGSRSEREGSHAPARPAPDRPPVRSDAHVSVFSRLGSRLGGDYRRTLLGL